MIYLRLAGGLGNQLFQVAAALALSGAVKTPIKIWTGALTGYDVARRYEIDRFLDLPQEHVSTKMTSFLHRMAMWGRIGRVLPAMCANDRNFRSVLAANVASVKHGTLFLDGYFQNGWIWPAFADVRVTLLKALRPVQLDPSDQVDCVMHIRGGDFLKFQRMHILDVDYYVRAIQEVRRKQPISVIQVVTDDPEHARVLCDAVGVEAGGVRFLHPLKSNSPQYDFELLRTAKARILCNSTFSWWAAALDDKEATTVTPDRWSLDVRKDWSLPWEIAIGISSGVKHHGK